MLMLRSEDRSVVMLLCDCLFCLVHSFGLFFILFNVRELFFCFFFFSSRRRHTRWTGDWSSDVCSSDLLVINWTRELRMWAEDVPYEVIGGDTQARKTSWFVSKCPLKLVNYELLTRDEIGRASCRERVEISVGAVALKKKRGNEKRGCAR